MNLYISEIREFVRARIDELAAEESDMLLDEIDDRNLDTTIDKVVEEAITYIHQKAPASLMEGRVLSMADLHDCVSLDNGVIDIDLSNAPISDKVLRLVSFKAGDSDIKLTEASYEDSPRARMQLNPFVQGQPDDPVLVQMDDSPDYKPHYRYYTTKMAEERLAFMLRYFPKPEAKTYSISLSSSRIRFGTGGGSKTIHVNTEIEWSVSSLPSWVRLSQSQGTGSTDIVVYVGENATTNEYATTIEFVTEQGNAYLEVQQSAARPSVPEGGGSTGDGGNTGGAEEAPFLNVVCDSAANGVITISPLGDFSLTELRVYAKRGLAWTAQLIGGDASSFYLSQTSGVGYGNQSYTTISVAAMSANNGSTAKTATLVVSAVGVSSKTFTLKQSVGLSITPVTSAIGAEGGRVSFSYISGGTYVISQLTSVSGVQWDGGQQMGSAGTGSISVTLPANTLATSREFRFKIEALGISREFSVMQAGATIIVADKAVQFAESSKSVGKDGGNFTAALVCSDGTEVSDVGYYSLEDWITITGVTKNSATSMTLSYTISGNTDNQRNGSIRVKIMGKDDESVLSITQEQGAVTSSYFSVSPSDTSTYTRQAQNVMFEVNAPYEWDVFFAEKAASSQFIRYEGNTSQSLTLPAGRYTFMVSLPSVSSDAQTTMKFTCGGTIKYVSLSQEGTTSGGYYIKPASTSMTLAPESGSTNSYLVQSNVNWSIQNAPSWATVEKTTSGSNTYVKVTTKSANFTSSDRKATITLWASSSCYANMDIVQSCAKITCANSDELNQNGDARSLSVSATHNWQVNSFTSSWLNASKASSTSLSLSAKSPNTSGEKRTQTITLSLVDYPSVTKTITISQAAEYVAPVVDELTFGSDKTIYVTCTEHEVQHGIYASDNWLVDSDSLPSWITAKYYVNDNSLNKSTLKLQIAANDGQERTATIKAYLSKNEDVYDELTITQGASITIKIAKGGKQYLTYTDSQDARAFDETFDIVTSAQDVKWAMQVAQGSSYFTINHALNGTGNATIPFNVAANSNVSTRTASVLIKAFDKVNTKEVVAVATYNFEQGGAVFMVDRSELVVTRVSQEGGIHKDTPAQFTLKSTGSWHLGSNHIDGKIIGTGLTIDKASGEGTDPWNGETITVSPNEEWAIGNYSFLLVCDDNPALRKTISVACRRTLADAVVFSSSRTAPLIFNKDKVDGQTAKMYMRVNQPWTASANASWIRFSPVSGDADTLYEITFNPQLIGAKQEGIVTFTAGGKTFTLKASEVVENIIDADGWDTGANG